MINYVMSFHLKSYKISKVGNANPLFHNVEKWLNILSKSCGVNTA